MTGYLLDLVTVWALFSVAATIVATLVEEAGFIHSGAAALMGCGAYTTAILSTEAGIDPWLALLGAMLSGLVAGSVIHLIVGRLQEDILALATLAIGVVGHGVMLNAEAVTSGAMGIAGIPRYATLTMHKALDAVLLLVIVIGLIAILRRSSLGMRIRALRDDEGLADDLVLRPYRVRWFLWVGSSVVLSLVGGLYAFHLRYIDPSSFTVRESVSILAMAMLVPAPKAINASLGALVFFAIPEILRFTGLPTGIGAEVRQLLFGVALLVVVSRAGGALRGLAGKRVRNA